MLILASDLCSDLELRLVRILCLSAGSGIGVIVVRASNVLTGRSADRTWACCGEALKGPA